ncbi:MAG: hypothetical protein LBV45_04100 [Xanthomonadaceae bacterium]|jgi:hypothetical protein|nr:hypothetical protein [Xanthomonadaceae bacterium]
MPEQALYLLQAVLFIVYSWIVDGSNALLNLLLGKCFMAENTGNTPGRVTRQAQAQAQDAASSNPAEPQFSLPSGAQTSLDILQVNPATATPAGIVDAGFSIADGRYVDATVAGISAIPVVGWVIGAMTLPLSIANGGTLENFSQNQFPKKNNYPPPKMPDHIDHAAFEANAFMNSERARKGLLKRLQEGGKVEADGTLTQEGVDAANSSNNDGSSSAGAGNVSGQ